MKQRFYFVPLEEWEFPKDSEPWWHFVMPFFDIDSYGRRTLVKWVPWKKGFYVLVLSTCHCPECVDLRKATLMIENGENGDAIGSRV